MTLKKIAEEVTQGMLNACRKQQCVYATAVSCVVTVSLSSVDKQLKGQIQPMTCFITTCKLKLFKYCKNSKKEKYATEIIWLQSLKHLLPGWTFTEKIFLTPA